MGPCGLSGINHQSLVPMGLPIWLLFYRFDLFWAKFLNRLQFISIKTTYIHILIGLLFFLVGPSTITGVVAGLCWICLNYLIQVSLILSPIHVIPKYFRKCLFSISYFLLLPYIHLGILISTPLILYDMDITLKLFLISTSIFKTLVYSLSLSP